MESEAEMSGKVPRERMAELRRGSKLRERLQLEIDETSERVKTVEEDIRFRYQQLSYASSYESDPVKRQNDIAYWQSNVNQVEAQLSALLRRLAVARQDLEDFEEATAEISAEASAKASERPSAEE